MTRFPRPASRFAPAGLLAAALASLPLLSLPLATTAHAQDTGGLRLAPAAGTGPQGLAQPLPFTYRPFVTAQEMQAQSMPSAAERRERHKGLIAKVRGDAGYLAGFSMGTPLAPSRQAPPPDSAYGADYGYGTVSPIIIQSDGPVAVAIGNDNLIQQQAASGPGPIAQQQVATVNRKTSTASTTAPATQGPDIGGIAVVGGGAVNFVSGNGNIVQRAPR